MQIYKSKSKILLACGLLVLGLTPLKTRALEISPLKYNLTMDSGGAQTVEVKTINNEPARLVLQPITLSARQDEQGRTLLGDGWDVAQSWVAADQAEFGLDSGQAKTVNFMVRVPADTAPGAHYVAIGVKEKNKPGVDGVGLGRQLLTILTVQVAGVAREEAVIERWDSKSYFVAPTWKFDLKIENNGNISVPLLGRVKLFDWRGREKWSGEIGLGNDLLAQTDRTTQVVVSALSGDFNLPGLYSAMVYVQYGATKQVVTAVTKFFYWPAWIFKTLILVLVVVIVWLVARWWWRTQYKP